MSSRAYTQELYSFHKKPVRLDAYVLFEGSAAPVLYQYNPSQPGQAASYTVASTAAVGLEPAGFQGIASIARNSTSTGDFIITLQDSFQRVLEVHKTLLSEPTSGTVGISTAPDVGIIDGSGASLGFNSTTAFNAIEIQTSLDGVAADPGVTSTSSEFWCITLILDDSTAG